jgi:hypothetical protein
MIDFEPLPPGSFSNWKPQPRSPLVRSERVSGSFDRIVARQSSSTASQDGGPPWNDSSPPTSFDSAAQSTKSDPVLKSGILQSSSLPYLQAKARAISTDDDLHLTDLDLLSYHPISYLPKEPSSHYSSWPKRQHHRPGRPRADEIWVEGLRSPSAGGDYHTFSTYRPPSTSSLSPSPSPSPRFNDHDSFAATPRTPYATDKGMDEATLRKTLSRPLESDAYMDSGDSQRSSMQISAATTASRLPLCILPRARR